MLDYSCECHETLWRGDVEVWLHAVVVSLREGCEWSASHRRHFVYNETNRPQ